MLEVNPMNMSAFISNESDEWEKKLDHAITAVVNEQLGEKCHTGVQIEKT